MSIRLLCWQSTVRYGYSLINAQDIRRRASPFATGSTCFALRPSKRPPTRSPTVKQLVRTPQPLNLPEESLTPELLLKIQSDVSLRQLQIAHIAHILKGFPTMYQHQYPDSNIVAQFCREHVIQPGVLTTIGKSLLRHSNQRTNVSLATVLLLAASGQKDVAATMFLMAEAIRKGPSYQSRHIISARQHLTELAQSNHPAATVLYAKWLESNGDHDAALALYYQVTTTRDDRYTDDDYQAALPAAWWNIGRLISERYAHRSSEAENALENAALRYDEPRAYFQLARRFRSSSDPSYHNYLMKAAVSGVTEAAFYLGKYHYGLSMGGNTALRQEKPQVARSSAVPSSHVRHHRNLAVEWLNIAAEPPRHPKSCDSQVFLAILLHQQGQLERGYEWLLKAQQASSQSRLSLISGLRAMWDQEETNLTTMDIGRAIDDGILGP